MSSYQLLKELTELQATSGREEEIRDYLKKKLSPYVDEFQTDGLGSLFGIKYSKTKDAPLVMLAGHMDEVGFMLTEMKANGLFQVRPLGGWNPQVVSAQRFTLQSAEKNFPVLSASIPPHLLKGENKPSIDLSSLLFDGGFESKEEAWQAGIRPGDSIVPDVETIRLANPNRVACKAFDNRYGCAAVIELAQELEGVDLPFHLVLGATVQEEVGLRGAQAAANKFKPDLFIAVDASPANDQSSGQEGQGMLNEGFLLRVQDPGFISPYKIRHYISCLAEKNQINYQYYFSKGGTDASAAQLAYEGIPSCVIGCPARYIHTHQTLFDLRDYQSAVDILIAMVKDLDQNKIKSFKEF